MSAATPQFPTATILAYPRIGRGRELKRALEARWAGRITEAELIQAANDLRKENLARLVELGLNPSDASLADAPSLYDHVLDATILLGAIPPRFAGREGLDLYFALARGDDKVGPEEMTKWFDTNYHYLVPEIGPDTPLRFADDTITRRFTDAREWGYVTRPVLVGPVTYLALAKADPSTPDFDPLTRIDEAVAAYEEALASLHAAGAPWVQLDEPALTSDNLSRTRVELGESTSAWPPPPSVPRSCSRPPTATPPTRWAPWPRRASRPSMSTRCAARCRRAPTCPASPSSSVRSTVATSGAPTWRSCATP